MSGLLYIILFTIFLVVSFLIHRYFLKRAHNYTLKKANISAERWSAQTKPIFGGVTFFVLFLISVLVFFFWPGLKIELSGLYIAIILVPTLGFIMGLADDIFNTPPNFKFIVQFIIAVLLIYFEIYINIFSNIYLNYIITIVWVIGIMNSVNMLDNMDAITSSVTVVILSGIFINMILNCTSNTMFFTILIIGAIASLVSFLWYNWHPSIMYMGDNGSQYIGALLAVLSILFCWNVPVIQGYDAELKSFFIVALAFIVPLSDTATVTINRLKKGKSPFIGGRDHTTHHLSYLGLKDNQVALLLIFITVVSVVLSVLLSNNIIELTNLSIVLLLIYIISIFGGLYSTTIISKPK